MLTKLDSTFKKLEQSDDITEDQVNVRRQLSWPVDDNYLGRFGVTIGTLFFRNGVQGV